jgi:hypothetical protein
MSISAEDVYKPSGVAREIEGELIIVPLVAVLSPEFAAEDGAVERDVLGRLRLWLALPPRIMYASA